MTKDYETQRAELEDEIAGLWRKRRASTWEENASAKISDAMSRQIGAYENLHALDTAEIERLRGANTDLQDRNDRQTRIIEGQVDVIEVLAHEITSHVYPTYCNDCKYDKKDNCPVCEETIIAWAESQVAQEGDAE